MITFPGPIPRRGGSTSSIAAQRPRRATPGPLIWGSYVVGYTLECDGYDPQHYPTIEQAEAVAAQITRDEALARMQARLLAVVS